MLLRIQYVLQLHRGSACFQVPFFGGGGRMLCMDSIREFKRRTVSFADVDAFETYEFRHDLEPAFAPAVFAVPVPGESDGVAFELVA